MPPKSEIADFMIVGKKSWLDREEVLIDCQADQERKESGAQP